MIAVATFLRVTRPTRSDRQCRLSSRRLRRAFIRFSSVSTTRTDTDDSGLKIRGAACANGRFAPPRAAVPGEGRVFDPMYGPAVRCKWFRRAGGERSCINVSGLRLEHLLRAIMDISARATSLPDRPRLDHLGHQCSHAPGRPNLHLYLSSRRPRLETVDGVTSSLAPHMAQFLCSSQGPFLRPGPQNVDRVARRGGQGRPSRLAYGWLRRCQAAP